MMEKNIFQRIIDREIPATIEYEDDEIIAIRDIAPSAPIHVLIIPKRAITSINSTDESDVETIGRVFLVARDLAKSFGISESGYRVVTNINSDGGQTVPHLHFHLLGGQPLGRMNSTHASGHGTGSPYRGTLREAGILILCAIGLAIGFNMMNSKSISWVKKEYDKVTATSNDLNKYLTSPANSPSTTTPSTPTTPNTAVPVESEDSKKTDPATTAAAKPAPVQEKPSFVAEPGVVKEITYDQFSRLMASAPYYLIDARGAEKYAEGHIGNATNFYGAEAQARIPDMLANVPRDRVILIYCDGGECELSHHVADVLKQFGYGPIFIFTGGWAEWKTKH